MPRAAGIGLGLKRPDTELDIFLHLLAHRRVMEPLIDFDRPRFHSEDLVEAQSPADSLLIQDCTRVEDIAEDLQSLLDISSRDLSVEQDNIKRVGELFDRIGRRVGDRHCEYSFFRMQRPRTGCIRSVGLCRHSDKGPLLCRAPYRYGEPNRPNNLQLP